MKPFTTYLVHIAADGREQTICDHLAGAARLAQNFAQSFQADDQGELVGGMHDVGKYSQEFQKRIHGDSHRVDHANAGAFECYQRGQPFAAFAIAGHHGGLPDGGAQTDCADAATFYGRMKRAMQGKLPVYDTWKSEINPPQAHIPDFTRKGMAEGMFFTRMLSSCLVDADYLDTEAFITGNTRSSDRCASIEQLWDRLCAYTAGWFSPVREINRQRCVILERCIKEGENRSRGLFSLTVPTGGGKTIASLAFALSHARQHGLDRVIYVIPYTSIIEQTAAVFREVLGSENVLEHHSNVLYDLEGEADTQNIHLAQATENWDMPVVVTTAVQFFESLYACRSSQCRKLHNIANSVVIFDEAQMMPVPYLRPCVHAIAQLVAHYRVSAVLCTATQPALQPIFQEFLPDHPITELCPQDTCQWEIFRRVTFAQAGGLEWRALANRLNGHKQVLCIVNTRKGAQELFTRLAGDGCFHLSTLMHPAHRRAQLTEIRNRLITGRTCRVVSTSLIEAGVDVDFPAVYREIAGLDSILQAAGRCNREGKRDAKGSVVTIFQSEERTPPLFSKSIGAGQEVMQKYEDLMSREAIHDYFCRLLDLTGTDAQDKQKILHRIQTEFFPFRSIARDFHLIDNQTNTIYIPVADGEELVARLLSGEHSRNLFRQLGQYGVSVYQQHFEALDEAGALEIVSDGTAILRDLSLYSEQTGLSLELDFGKGLFI